jgi:hypothetical protein
MKPENQDRLLKDIFVTGEPEDFRQQTLEGGLSVLRRKRRIRLGLTLVAFTMLLCQAFRFINFPDYPHRWSSKSQRLNPQSLITPKTESAEIKFINDEQLLALFPDRSVALVGKPGHQKLLFLDEPNGREREKM